MPTNTTNMSLQKPVDGDNAKTAMETYIGGAFDTIDAHTHAGTTSGLAIPYSSISPTAWTAFTPTLAQLSAVTATVNIAHYQKIGRRVEVFIQMTATAAGTAGNPIIVTTLPAAILPLTNNTAAVTGWGYVLISAPARLGALLAFSSGQLEILIDNSGVIGVAPSVALANGSVVTMWGSWETAS